MLIPTQLTLFYTVQALTLRYKATKARGPESINDIKIMVKKQDFCLIYILFWAASLKSLGAQSKI